MSVFENVEQILESEGQYVTVLHGDSMWPMLRSKKDPVLICSPKRTERPLKRGDVVAYRSKDRYVVHRILKVCNDHYIIRGDNCISLELVPHNSVIGIVTMWWRDGKCHIVNDRGYRCYIFCWLTIHPLVRLCKRLKLRLYYYLREHL